MISQRRWHGLYLLKDHKRSTAQMRKKDILSGESGKSKSWEAKMKGFRK